MTEDWIDVSLPEVPKEMWNISPSICAGGERVWFVRHTCDPIWKYDWFETEADALAFVATQEQAAAEWVGAREAETAE